MMLNQNHSRRRPRASGDVDVPVLLAATICLFCACLGALVGALVVAGLQ